MKTFLKPMMMTALLALPLLGVASAGPVSDLQDRRADIRQALRDHRDDLNTARRIHDEDGIINAQARIREDEALLRANTSELARLNAHPKDEPGTQTYMIKRTIVAPLASPYEAEFAPQYKVRYDPVTAKPYYIRVYP
jgi:hypothetical protein